MDRETPQHECLIDGCGKRVDIAWAICRVHWKLLPLDHSSAIARAYVPSVGLGLEFPSPALARALRSAVAWIRSELAAADDNWDPGAWERLKAMVRAKDEARAARRALEPKRPHLTLVP